MSSEGWGVREVDGYPRPIAASIAFTLRSGLACKISSLANSSAGKDPVLKAYAPSFDADDSVNRNTPAMLLGS